MSNLTPRDRELVALGAAMGSNCVPCIEYHIPESRKTGLTDAEIRAAIGHADKIRQVPARKTLQAALNKLQPTSGEARNAGTTPEGGGATGESESAGTSGAAQPMEVMVEMMSRMMATHCGQATSANVSKSPPEKPDVKPATGEGCGCG